LLAGKVPSKRNGSVRLHATVLVDQIVDIAINRADIHDLRGCCALAICAIEANATNAISLVNEGRRMIA
jgi:hypothetical protein